MALAAEDLCDNRHSYGTFPAHGGSVRLSRGRNDGAVEINRAKSGTRCSGSAFAVRTPRIAADGAEISLSATLTTHGPYTLRVEYDGELRSGYQSHTGQFKAGWNF